MLSPPLKGLLEVMYFIIPLFVVVVDIKGISPG